MKAIVEMPKGTKHKYEIKDGKIHLDRVLTLRVPQNYGYIANTLAGDGDPVDVFVLSEEPISSMAECDITPIKIIYGIDNGKEDHKIIATLNKGYFRYDVNIKALIVEYLTNYKTGFEIKGFGEHEEAVNYINSCKGE